MSIMKYFQQYSKLDNSKLNIELCGLEHALFIRNMDCAMNSLHNYILHNIDIKIEIPLYLRLIENFELVLG